MKSIAALLEGAAVRLEALAESHRAGLKAAAADEAIWTYLPFPATGQDFDVWFGQARAAMEQGAEAAFAVILKDDGRIVGSTRYMNIVPKHERLEIGHTFYAADCWGTPVNPDAKFLLLEHAFERLDMNRVELKTDSRNARSRKAIEKLGASLDGILRAHMVMSDGYVRDTAMYSILKTEWPAVRAALEARRGV